MATAIRIARIEPGFYRTRADALTGDDARLIAEAVNDEFEAKDELELEDKSEDLE